MGEISIAKVNLKNRKMSKVGKTFSLCTHVFYKPARIVLLWQRKMVKSVYEKKVDLRNLALAQLTDFMVDLGLPGKRAKHLFSWLQRPGITEFSQMVDIKKEIHLILSEHMLLIV